MGHFKRLSVNEVHESLSASIGSNATFAAEQEEDRIEVFDKNANAIES